MRRTLNGSGTCWYVTAAVFPNEVSCGLYFPCISPNCYDMYPYAQKEKPVVEDMMMQGFDNLTPRDQRYVLKQLRKRNIRGHNLANKKA